MLKRITGGLLVLAILGCLASIVGKWAVAYVLSFAILILVTLFGLLAFVVNFTWKFLPYDIKRAYEGKNELLSVVIFVSGWFFFLAASLISKNCLPDASQSIHFLVNSITFAFAIFLASSVFRPNRLRMAIGGGIVFAFLISILVLFSSTVSNSGEDLEPHSIDSLKALGYVDWGPAENDIEKRGVTLYDHESTFDGINIFFSERLGETYLIDMSGHKVHEWIKKIRLDERLGAVELYENGDLLVIVTDQMLVRLGWNSNIRWSRNIRAHHDVRVDEDNNIYVIAREEALVFWHRIPVPILSDYVAVLSSDGEITKKIRIYDIVREQVSLRDILKIYRGILSPIDFLRIFYYKATQDFFFKTDRSYDALHTNSIQILDRDIDGFCRRGDWLISIRQLNLIGVVDNRNEELRWSWGPGELSRQHQPGLLKSGNVLIFDNGVERGFSRIIELDPLTRRIVWEYTAKPSEGFFSRTRGSCQRLPNGNTLIAESDRGRVFEISGQGRVVWEFYNPEVESELKKRAAIYRMIRTTDPKGFLALNEGRAANDEYSSTAHVE